MSDDGGNLNGILVGGIAGAGTIAVLTGDPFQSSRNTAVRNKNNWYNPCAFSNQIYPGQLSRHLSHRPVHYRCGDCPPGVRFPGKEFLAVLCTGSGGDTSPEFKA